MSCIKWMHVKIDALCSHLSLVSANLNFLLSKVVQQHTQGVVRDAKPFCSTFRRLSSGVKFWKIG